MNERSNIRNRNKKSVSRFWRGQIWMNTGWIALLISLEWNRANYNLKMTRVSVNLFGWASSFCVWPTPKWTIVSNGQIYGSLKGICANLHISTARKLSAYILLSSQTELNRLGDGRSMIEESGCDEENYLTNSLRLLVCLPCFSKIFFEKSSPKLLRKHGRQTRSDWWCLKRFELNNS